MSEWYVYIIQLSNSSYYTGCTKDIDNRMRLHREGKGSKYVRSFLPFNLVYLEKVVNKSIALKREIEIKKMSRKDKKFILLHEKNLIRGEKHGRPKRM